MKLPQRWLDYTDSGRIKGTRFVALKVPLKQGYNRSLLPENSFTPQSVLQKYPRIKLVIDLTNTTKYYSVAEFEKNGIQHIKIRCLGHVIPSDKNFQDFVEAVDGFLSTVPPDFLIGVHCTHGVNRTGYIIVRYMIERLGYSCENALKTIDVHDPTLRKIAQEINLAEMLLLQYLKEVSMNQNDGNPSQKAAVDHLSQLVVKELEYLNKVKNSEVVDVTGNFATFKSDDGEFLVTVIPEEELQQSFRPFFCFNNIKPRFAKPVNSRENFAVTSPSAESVYYDALYDLPATQPSNLPSETPEFGRSIVGLLSYIFASTIGKMDAADGQTLFK